MSSEHDHGTSEGQAGPATAAGKGTRPPTHIYVNYLFADHSAAKHTYLFTLAGQDVQAAVMDAVREIENGKAAVDGSPDHIKWKHRSYIAFVLNDARQRLTGVDFKHDETGANHTFSAEQFLTEFDTYSGVYYLNERKNKHGRPLQDQEEELYRWKAHHSPRGGANVRRRRTHENSGTNLGP